MRNAAQNGTLSRIVKDLSPRLPSGWRIRAQSPAGAKFDGLLKVSAPDGSSAAFALQVVGGLEPRDVLGAIERLRKAAGGRPLAFLAPFISPRTRDLLRDAGASYADATGNVCLVLERPGLFIERRGSDKDPDPVTRPLRSLKGAAAGRVVRALCDLDPPYGIRELAQKASTALGSVARVVGLLDREALVVRGEGGGLEGVHRTQLMRRWVQDYALQRSNEVLGCLAPRGVPALLDRLKGLRGYSVTGSLAASRRRPVAPARLAMVYAREPEELAEALGVRQTDAGANVLVLRPYDPVVFERTWSEDGLVFAALSQVVADLLTSPGRGPSEGEELLRWMQENVSGWNA